jgi:glycosyltransferase involved in cell wall biosynthesis
MMAIGNANPSTFHAGTRRGHIVILVENLPVPFDRRVWMESLALTEAGYKVSVVCPQPPNDDREHLVLEDVNIYRYRPPAPTESKFSFVREFAYCYWQTRKLVARIWRDDRFDVLQTCNPPDTFWYLAKPYKRKGVKFVFDHHDLCPELYESKYQRRDFMYRALCWLERQQFATADAVIATNESYKDVALRRGRKKSEDVAVVRSGPVLAKFRRVEPDPALRRGRKFLCVYLGVMGAQDGVDYALRAIRHAVDAGQTDASFAFIGSGDEFHRLVTLTSELGLKNYVEFTGRISDDELRLYLSTADLGLAPDPKNPLNDVSTMNKIIEYMAMGIPIVSFDLKESRCSAEEAAVYVPNNDERAMGATIRSLLADPPRRRSMSEFGMMRVRQVLAWDHSRTVLLDFYDRLLLSGAKSQLAHIQPTGLPISAHHAVREAP